MGRDGLAGAAHLELVSGVVPLRPEDAMTEAMLRGWRAQQAARGLTERTITRRERLVRGFLECTNEFPWNWTPAHVDEWSLSLTSEKHLAPSTIRNYQMELRLFSEFLVDGRYGWAVACEEAFGTHPVPICHEWNTRLHLSQYEGRPEARPFTREELQRFFDYADDQVERAVAAKRKGALAAYRDATVFKVIYAWGCAAPRPRNWIWPAGAATRRRQSSAGSGCCTSATARPSGASRPAGATSPRSWAGPSTRWPTMSRTSGPGSAALVIRHCG
jgi:integrase/recombinase XerC